jgi:MOSC domain-containing protein YiiM
MPPPTTSPLPELEFTDHGSGMNSYRRQDSSGELSFDSSASECSDAVCDNGIKEVLEDYDQDPLTLTVKGLYAKRVMPGARFLPRDYTLKDLNKHQVMCRRRILTKPVSTCDDNTSVDIDGDEKYEVAKFEPVTGLVNGFFWHTDPTLAGPGRVMEDRAILFQSEEHYERLQKEPGLKSCFDDFDYKETPSFGEQVIVQGCDSRQLSIGDIFEVEGNLSPLVVEVTCPRKPCHYVDKRHGSELGSNGMKRYALTNSLSGWFCRVLKGGELRDGMKLIRTKHPHPKWTLAYTSAALYSGGSKLDLAMCRAHWRRSKDELQELVSIPQLSPYEWKDEAMKLLDKWEDGSCNEEKGGVNLSTSFRKQIFAFVEVKRDNKIVGSIDIFPITAWTISLMCIFVATLAIGATYTA